MKKKEKENVWLLVLKSALSIPGVLVNRDDFLKKQLSVYCEDDQVEEAIKATPKKAKIDKRTISLLAEGCIKWQTIKVASLSFGTGLPGGWWIAATIPADLAQFYWNVIILAQKLAYLYGWPQISEEHEKIDDETLYQFTIFVGVMSGVKEAVQAINILAKNVSNEAMKRIPRIALTKYGIYNLSKQVARWLGISLTKSTFGRAVSRVIPILGGFISGGLSYVMMKKMGNKLKTHLETLPLAD